MIHKTFERINQKKMIFFSFTVGISFSLLLSALTIFDFFQETTVQNYDWFNGFVLQTPHFHAINFLFGSIFTLLVLWGLKINKEEIDTSKVTIKTLIKKYSLFYWSFLGGLFYLMVGCMIFLKMFFDPQPIHYDAWFTFLDILVNHHISNFFLGFIFTFIILRVVKVIKRKRLKESF